MAVNVTERYRARRKRIMEHMGGGIALIGSSGVSPDRMLWDKNLRYLTGLDSRHAYLLLAPDGVIVERRETLSAPELGRGRKVFEILFVEERSPEDAFMEGAGSAFEEIQQATGADRVYSLSMLDNILESVLLASDTLWLNTPAVPSPNAPLTPDLLLINRLRERFYWVQFKNIATTIHQMRFVKEDYEVACLRRAFEVQTKIFEAIMRALKPGENESLGQAIYDYEIQIRAADQVSHGMKNDLYSSNIIVGSGKNSAIPHYLANNQVIQDGDLVLIDTGVAVDGYFSDITRTFPANGRFTPRQREVYAIVLEAELAAIETMKPGSTMLAAHQAVYDVFKKYDLDQYGYGNCGHPVGLNIHDANGRYPDDREQPFEPGVVVVIEPFLMLTEEGMGIRIEDGVLITDRGHEVLAGPPKEIAAVEQLCRRD
jgi:Xaa-Pro aminopeptidase